MHWIFVNLKRFDVPKTLGGICPSDDPVSWITEVVRDTGSLAIGASDGLDLCYLVPEALLPAAAAAIRALPGSVPPNLTVGCQSVYRNDVRFGGNFGAFTSNLPAAAARTLGASWAIVGHSEERGDKLELVTAGADAVVHEADSETVAAVVDGIVNSEALCALDRGINVLLCMGESEEQRGAGKLEEQKPRIKRALRRQVELGLAGIRERLADSVLKLVIGYEPIWAIGPGKTPPDRDYIEFVASFIKDTALGVHGLDVPVVYGGGLKEANAIEIGSVASVDGGLVALTRFTDPIGFRVDDLNTIISLFQESKGLAQD